MAGSLFERNKNIMGKIIKIENLKYIIKDLKKQNRKIVLVGGCFDIFHFGHFVFLRESKKLGDELIILLESDIRVKKLKGINRPVTTQKSRAEVLSAFYFVDYVVMLPNTLSINYEKLVSLIKPKIIAVTEGDPKIKIKNEESGKINAELKIIPKVNTPSTTNILRILNKEVV